MQRCEQQVCQRNHNCSWTWQQSSRKKKEWNGRDTTHERLVDEQDFGARFEGKQWKPEAHRKDGMASDEVTVTGPKQNRRTRWVAFECIVAPVHVDPEIEVSGAELSVVL